MRTLSQRARRRLATVTFVVMLSAWCPARAAQMPATMPTPSSPPTSPAAVERLDVAFAAFDAVDQDDHRWTARTLRGRIVLLDFWATWCAPCLVELPALKRLQARHAGEPFTLIGVNLDVMDRRTLAGWLRRQAVTWPQIHDRRGYEGDLARAFEVEALPRTVLLDAEGRVIALNLRGDALARAVDDALQALPPSSPR